MLHVVLCLAFVALCSAAPGPVPDDCMYCICYVESNCVMPEPICKWDVYSESCGPYQIKEPYWIDGGRLGGDWKSCTATFDCSERTVQGYMSRYATINIIGYPPTCHEFSRIHNGGPNGWYNPNTEAYWDKILACLTSLKV